MDHLSDLHSDIDVTTANLDAVASFQQDDYVMTDAEARALADTSNKNRPKIRAKSLPTRGPRQSEIADDGPSSSTRCG
jgi:hypothetical protein